MKHLILSITTLFVASQAFSNPFEGLKNEKEALCYGREYSADHLKKNPKQQVQKLRAKMHLSDSEYKTPILNIEASLRGEKNEFKNYRASLVCLDKAENGSLRCFIECDGGSVELSLKDNGDRLELKNNGFVLQGGCGEEEADFAWLNEAKGGDDLFYLYKLRSEYCQKK